MKDSWTQGTISVDISSSPTNETRKSKGMLFETSKFKCSEKYEKKEKAITILRQEFQLKKNNKKQTKNKQTRI